jgi:hypothetical protein
MYCTQKLNLLAVLTGVGDPINVGGDHMDMDGLLDNIEVMDIDEPKNTPTVSSIPKMLTVFFQMTTTVQHNNTNNEVTSSSCTSLHTQ